MLIKQWFYFFETLCLALIHWVFSAAIGEFVMPSTSFKLLMKLLNRIVIGMLQGFFSTIELIDEPKHFGKYYIVVGGFSVSASGKEPACQCRRHKRLRFDPLQKEMATHSIILAWEILWTEEPSRLQFIGLQESDTVMTTPPPHIQVKLNTFFDQKH